MVVRIFYASTLTMSIGASINKRGRPATGKGTQVVVRLQPDDLAALDAHIAEHPEPKPSRPEAIRRVLSERFIGRGRKKLDTAPDVAAVATKVRSEAAHAANEAMSKLDAPVEVKARRRAALTEKPAMVAKARGKGSRR